MQNTSKLAVTDMNEWKEYRLGELIDNKLAELQTGPFGTMLNASEYVSNGIPVIAVQDIGDNKLIHNKFVYIDNVVAERLKRYRVLENDIIFGRKGAVERRALIKKSEEGWLQGSDCIRLRLDASIDSKFISYQLSSNSNKEWMMQHATGATMPSLNQQILRLLPLRIPSEAIQKSISDILSSLDDKIDLLHRQNKTLEAMAETLFRQWFVEELEESWETESLEKHFDISIGRTPPRNQHQWFSTDKEETKWVSIKDMGANGVYINSVSEYLTEEAIRKFHIPIIPASTTILSFKMTVGRIKITTESMVSNEAIAQFQVKDSSPLYSEFIYLFLKTFQWQQLGSTSSIVDAINTKIIREIEIPVADKYKLGLFKKLIEPHFRKILANQTQMKSIAKLRDELLPRLMKGEVILKS